jgi:cyclopropane-fatty-acyl-phospholipid synthase
MNTTTAPPARPCPRAPPPPPAPPATAAAPAARHLTVQLPDGTVQHLRRTATTAPRLTAHWHCATGTSAPRRSSRATSVCRKLHRRRLDHHQPDRPAQAVHRQPREVEGRDLRHLGRPAAVPHQALLQPQHQGQQPEEHPRPLRPGQPVLCAVAGRHDELLVGLVRGRPGATDARRPAAKVRRALRMARVQPGDRVLEIGCGWGALAEMATTEFGATLTGVTLSTEQLAFARQRMERAGVATGSGQADLRLQDYRDIHDGPYDAVCSIEMVEAVGREYWPTYFQSVSRLLKPGGRACIQSIVIDDSLFKRYIAPPTSSSSTSSRAAACPARANSAARPLPPACGGGRVRLRPGLRRNPAPLARAPFWPSAARSCSSALTSASCTSGSSTWPTAKRRSTWATSTGAVHAGQGHPMNRALRQLLIGLARRRGRAGGCAGGAQPSWREACPTRLTGRQLTADLPGLQGV